MITKAEPPVTRGRSHKPRNAGGLQKLKKVRDRFSPKLPEGKQTCQHLDFTLLTANILREQVTLFSVAMFVTAATGSSYKLPGLSYFRASGPFLKLALLPGMPVSSMLPDLVITSHL